MLRCREWHERLQEHPGYAQPRIVGKSSQPVVRGGAGSQPNSRGGAGSQPNSRGGAILGDVIFGSAASRLRELVGVLVGSTPSSVQPCQFMGNELVSHSSEQYG